MKQLSQKTRDLLATMEADAKPATPVQLTDIRAKLAEYRNLQYEQDSLRQRILDNHEALEKFRFQVLPEIFDSAHISKLRLEPEGNYPAFEVEIGAHYHANIAQDWEPERREKAHGWLAKNAPDLIGQTFTIKFGKKSSRMQKSLAAFLRKNKIDFSNEYGVPWNTLTAWIREQIETYKRTPPLELLGAKVGRAAIIKKEKKTNGK